MREYLLTLFVAAAVTYLLAGALRRFAGAIGAVAVVRDRDVHAIPIPRLGGIAMFGGLCAALFVARQLPFLGSIYADSRDPSALLWGGGLICLLGIVDDRWEIDSLTKLAGQALAASVIVIQGIQVIWLPIPGLFTLSLGPTEGVVLSVLLVVVTINAVNLVDGLDGLAAGMVAIGALTFFGYSYWLWVQNGVERAASPMLFAVVLTGICVGFLPHNFHPSRIIMGDSGSMLIGLLLAASSISFTGQIDPSLMSSEFRIPVLLPLLLPIVVIAIPFLDLSLTIIRRARAGRPLFSPDKQHLHHRLLEIGHSHRRAVLIMYLWAALVAFGAVVLPLIGEMALIVIFAVVTAGALVAIRLPRLLAARRR